MNARSVAIVIPMYKATLSSAEELSLQSLRHHLSGYPVVLVVPAGLDVTLDGFSTLKFPASYFTGRHAYSALLVSRQFYEALQKYEFILIYQLDCLVFSNQLTEWCDRGFDYIGAPWVHPNEAGQLEFTGVGNGGFSLRRVQACLEVLAMRDRQRRWSDGLGIASVFAGKLARSIGRGVRAVFRADTEGFFKRSRRAVTFAAHVAIPEYQNEDLFWARASTLLPTFSIPGPEIAVSFAFEMEPRFCFEFNRRALPFGCHQWQAYDRAFWEPLLPIATGGSRGYPVES
jgi:hypothetical protein